MTRRNPLPPELRGQPFSVARASRLGLARTRTRASDLIAPFSGARIPSVLGDAYAVQCRALIAALGRSAILSGVSAARLHGLPLPHRIDPRLIEIAVRPPARAIRRNGVIGRRLDIDDADITRVSDIPLTTVSRTWCDLSGTLTLIELVAVGDAIGHTLGVAATIRLASAVDLRRDRRHSAKLSRALALIDPRAESPKETELRILLADAGLPATEVNPTIRDGARFVARVDLLFPSHRVVVEYQGDHHRTDRAQWRRDITRRAELESLGYVVIEVTDDDLRHPHALVARVRRILESRSAPA